MNQNQQQYLQRAAQVLKEHGMGVNVKNISHFVNGVIPENIIQEWIEAEQEMQALDQALDTEWLKDAEEVRKRAIANGKALDLPEEEWEDFSSSGHYFDECYHKDSVPCDCLKEAYRAWKAYQSEELDLRKQEF